MRISEIIDAGEPGLGLLNLMTDWRRKTRKVRGGEVGQMGSKQAGPVSRGAPTICIHFK